ncbi:hypothetical protein A1Q1_04114 [Trichosporon asahii var. asahii CBS 2479]|uniref:Uncharacterized protein n=1 Tax=Trichosporon asahii var. asahii (strain ATCC 90039 / CBS 2479 / JCM 2466 / KCTC 7840 / NBRC 103889/ NCYC 2677 / UAMH 7654) TaxID=1186058 RepID=J5SRF2_TRIAS|nr:hypothetical protein A1Q1_04114 [Trichosporon asahii var. asahii CBS 2479]EJT47121.1 hypothetical protein A1Q1_04114 [Trichosporon asahii var. asahii CBS 2479]
MITSLPPASVPTPVNEVISSEGVPFVVDVKLESPIPSGTEDAESLSSFLSYLSTGELSSPLPGTFALLSRYAPSQLRAAHGALTAALIDGSVCPLQAFVVGARAHDLQLCRLAIVHGDNRTQDEMDWSAWEDVEPRYKRALEEAWGQGGSATERGNRFVEILSLQE